jgi:hypothetical protein
LTVSKDTFLSGFVRGSLERNNEMSKKDFNLMVKVLCLSSIYHASIFFPIIDLLSAETLLFINYDRDLNKHSDFSRHNLHHHEKGGEFLMAMTMPNSLCQQFAKILGGTAEVANGVCTVTRLRNNLRPLIDGRRTNSILAIAAFFTFEDLDSRGNALNLGETVILQEEINPFISALRAQGIEVTAFHNHWLFDNPRLMFIHFKSVEPPLSFAIKAANAFRVLTTRTIGPNSSTGGSSSSGNMRSWGSCGCSRSSSSRGISRSIGAKQLFTMSAKSKSKSKDIRIKAIKVTKKR